MWLFFHDKCNVGAQIVSHPVFGQTSSARLLHYVLLAQQCEDKLNIHTQVISELWPSLRIILNIMFEPEEKKNH